MSRLSNNSTQMRLFTKMLFASCFILFITPFCDALKDHSFTVNNQLTDSIDARNLYVRISQGQRLNQEGFADGFVGAASSMAENTGERNHLISSTINNND